MKKILFLLVLATSTMADEPKPEIQPSSFPFQGETKAETVSNKLEQTVISFLDATQEAGSKLSNAADKAISFATGEIPLVIKEYLNWHFAISLAWFFIGVAVLLAALYFFYRVIYKNRDLPWATKDGYLTE